MRLLLLELLLTGCAGEAGLVAAVCVGGGAGNAAAAHGRGDDGADLAAAATAAAGGGGLQRHRVRGDPLHQEQKKDKLSLKVNGYHEGYLQYRYCYLQYCTSTMPDPGVESWKKPSRLFS
eukprot:1150800-Pelagomonas_calceolata.AAC.1